MPEGLEAAIYADAASELVGHVVTSRGDDRCTDSNELSILVGQRVQMCVGTASVLRSCSMAINSNCSSG